MRNKSMHPRASGRAEVNAQTEVNDESKSMPRLKSMTSLKSMARLKLMTILKSNPSHEDEMHVGSVGVLLDAQVNHPRAVGNGR